MECGSWSGNSEDSGLKGHGGLEGAVNLTLKDSSPGKEEYGQKRTRAGPSKAQGASSALWPRSKDSTDCG